MAEYADLLGIHDPATNGLAPAAWGDQIRENEERLAKPYRVRVRRTTSQAIPTAASTQIIWDTQDYDINNGTTEMWVPGAPTNLVCPVQGLYSIKFGYQFAINATGIRLGWIGTGSRVIGIKHDIGNATWYAGGSVVAEEFLPAGTVVTCNVYQSSGANLNIEPATVSTYEVWATMHLVSR